MNGAPQLQSVLHPAGIDAAIISQFAWVLSGAAALILAAVMLLLALALRGGPRPVAPMRWIAGGGIVLPLVLLAVLLIWSTWRAAQLTAQSSAQKMTVSVTAKMWWWEVRYRNPATGLDVITANEIHLPVGVPVYLGLSSGDVIHSFWVPSLSGKIDTVPGRMTGLTLTATKAGLYRGQCAEFCGEQHARMGLHVVAESPEQFAAWLAHQQQPAAMPANALAVRGRQVFEQQRCASCHGAGPSGQAPGDGPSLTHLGSRLYLGAGTVPLNSATLEAWIANPHAIKPGVRMPAANDIDPASLRALAAYLAALK
jgi:cytochrome c oxidase subunit 2